MRAKLDPRKRSLLHDTKNARMKYELSLRPTCGTLILVPEHMLEHWADQLKSHLHLPTFSRECPDEYSGSGVVYIDGFGDLADYDVTNKKPLPSAVELSRFLVVVTTFGRCASELALDPSLFTAGDGPEDDDARPADGMSQKQKRRSSGGVQDDDDSEVGRSGKRPQRRSAGEAVAGDATRAPSPLQVSKPPSAGFFFCFNNLFEREVDEVTSVFTLWYTLV